MTQPRTPPMPDLGARPPSRVSRFVERLDAFMHRIGVRVLSPSWLRLLVWLGAIASLAVNASLMTSLYDALVPVSLAVAVLHAATLVWSLSRPRFAVGAAAVATAATTVLTADGHGFPWPIPVSTLVTTAMLVMILAVTRSWRPPVSAVLATIGAATVTGALSHRTGSWGALGGNLVTATSILAVVATFGILVHEWLRSRAELVEQQGIAAAAQERRLLMEERNRIARELHDVVAHGLSVISIQASTMPFRVHGLPPTAVGELEEITTSARSALVEMRGLLAVLRQEDGDAELAPQPGLSRIAALVESTRRGIDHVELSVTGDLAAGHLSEATSLTAYRIVQEALSNALRHAPGSEIEVRLEITDTAVVVEVENGPAREARVGGAGGDGFGLRGMRERVSFVGGSLVAEPTASGGFLVRAVLPARAR